MSILNKLRTRRYVGKRYKGITTDNKCINKGDTTESHNIEQVDSPSGDGFNISANGLASWEYKDTNIRKDWDSYFIDIAKMVATRSTCDRLSVGCVIVKNHRIISTGYNGSVSGTGHCDDEGHLLVNGRCVRTIHAEQNAILFAKDSIEDATVYVTHEPCEVCLKLLVQAGVSEIIYANEYYNETTTLLKAAYCRKCYIHKYMG